MLLEGDRGHSRPLGPRRLKAQLGLLGDLELLATALSGLALIVEFLEIHESPPIH